MSAIEKPLFIIGTGRCGSTIFYEMFARHPQLAWFSSYPRLVRTLMLHRFYNHKIWLHKSAMIAIDLPVVGKYIDRRITTAENYRLWNSLYPGFGTPCRDLVASDVTNPVKARMKSNVVKLLTPKRNRLLAKITGWPRVGFLKEIFPDAKFIHIMRDGRAVANSVLQVPWWWGWRGPSNWRWGELPDDMQREWEMSGKSFVVLAGLEWKILMEAFDKAKQTVSPKDFLDIKYEDICDNPTSVFRKVVEFSELEWSAEFEQSLDRFKLRNTNHKWRQNLTEEQQKALEDVIKPSLERYGYLP